MEIVDKKGNIYTARLSSLSLRVILTSIEGGELLEADIPAVSKGSAVILRATSIDVKRTFRARETSYSLVSLPNHLIDIKKGDSE